MRNFKKILSLVLCMAMMLSIMVVGAGAAFKDQSKIVNTEAVDVCVALNIINGYTDGSYKPEGTITRAEACKMICVALNGGKEPVLGTNATASFTDIKGHWAEGYIEYCVAEGIVAGIGGGKFNPNGNVTGSQFAKMLLIALGYRADHEKFVGNAWEVNVNVKASQKGLYEDLASMDPSVALTRDNAAQMLWNALQAKEVKYEYTLVSENGQLVSKVTVKDTATTLLWDKYTALIADAGTLKSVKYDDKNDDYNTIVNGVNSGKAFDADKDYSDLIGQNVKVIYKAKVNGESTTFDSLYGIYATDKNQTVTAVVGDIEGTIAAEETVEIDDVEYDMAKTVSVIAENGATYAGTLQNYYEVTLIDYNDDDKYEVVVVNPIKVVEVTSVTSDYAYFKEIGKTDTITVDVDKMAAYGGMAKEDYALLVDDAYTVSGDTEVVAADTISGTVTNTKDDGSIKVDGTWYKAAITATVKAGNKLTSAVVLNGYYFTYDTTTSDTAANTAVVLNVADKTEWNSDFYKVDLLFANGETKTTTAKVDVGDTANASKKPAQETLYTYEAKGDGYELTAVATGADIDVGTAPAITGTYSSETNKVNNDKRVASDAVVYAVYNDDGVIKGKVVTGADADAWKNVDGGYEVAFAYADKTVEVMYIDLGNTDKVPGASSDAAYAVILGDIVNGEDETKVATLWTADGIIEDAVINGEELATNSVYEYTMDGEEYDLTATATAAIAGAVIDIDGNYITVLTARGEVEYYVNSDTVKLFVDTKNDKGANDGSIIEATEFERNQFYGNVIIVIDDDDDTDGKTELGCIVVDIQNKLLNANDDPYTFVKVVPEQ